MDRMPWVAWPSAQTNRQDARPRNPATATHGLTRVAGLTRLPDNQSNHAAIPDVECGGAGRQPWSCGAGSGGGAYGRLNTWVWFVALVTCSRIRV
jgi:hypothetical protein